MRFRVFQDMIELCERICPDEIQSLLGNGLEVEGVEM